MVRKLIHYAYTHTHIHTHTYAYTHTHTHTHVYLSSVSYSHLINSASFWWIVVCAVVVAHAVLTREAMIG